MRTTVPLYKLSATNGADETLKQPANDHIAEVGKMAGVTPRPDIHVGHEYGPNAEYVSSDGNFPASGNLNRPRESTAKLTKMHSNAVQPHARVGTVYYDEATGEAVMPPDFFGEGELRWKADPPFPKRETAPQGETAINLEQGERMPLTLEQVRKAGRFAICIDGDKAHAYCPRTEEFSTIKPVKEYEGIGIRREFAEEWFQKMFDCEMCCKKITCGAIHHADCACARCAGSS